MRYVKTGRCIWCGKTEPKVSFKAAPHIVPHNLGSDDIDLMFVMIAIIILEKQHEVFLHAT